MSQRELLLESCEARILCDAAPEVSLQAPTNAQIGEQLEVTATFDNASATDTGFGPYIDLVLDTTGADGAGAAVNDGVSFVSASYLGTPVNATVLTFDAAGQAIHPYAKDAAGNPLVVNAPPGYGEGDSLVVLQLPFGSYSPSQPSATVNITLQMSNLADLDTPLNISARGGFQYGNDALDNPTTDPSIVDPTYANAAVTPTLFTLRKTYLGPEDETATGPNFERQYRIELDVATGQTLTDVQLNDLLPGNLQFVRVDSLTGGPENVGARVTPDTTTPGGTLSRTITSITGVAGVDATLTFTAYVPRIDSGGAAIIDATTGNDATVPNNISGSGTWTPLDPRDTPVTSTVDVAGPEHTLTAKSIVVQKSAAIVTNLGSPGASPGDVVEYTLDVQVSDYFAFQDLKLTDVLSDGQRFDSSFTPTITWTEQGTTFGEQNFLSGNYTVTPNFSAGAGDGSTADGTDGTTSIEFRLSPEIARPIGQDQFLLGGGIPAGGIGTGALPNNPPLAFTPGTTVRVKFRAIIQDAFTDDLPSGNPSLNPRDVLTDNATIDGQLLDVRTLAPTLERETDNSSASITIANTAITKSIYAINGSLTLPTTPSGAILVRPGDTVTYRLTYTVPSGDVENLVLNDYLPSPIFSAASVTTFSLAAPSTTPPPAGQASWGPLETLREILGTPIPSISSTPENNLLSFTYPITVDDVTNSPRTVDLLFTVTVNNAPFADGLFLTNQVQASENNTQEPATSITSDAIIQVVVQQPTISTLRKGIVGYNNTGLTLGTVATGQFTFTAPGTTSTLTGPPVFNPLQAASIGLNDLLGGEVDAGDAVRFAVVLQNEGRSDSYDVTFTDQVINPGYNLPIGATDNDRLDAIRFTLFRGDGTTLVRGTDYTATLTASGLLTVTLIDNYTSGNLAGDTGSGGLSRGFNANNATLVTNGSNTIVATYDLTLSPGVPNLGATVTNTATLTNFASVEGGTDFTGTDITGSGRVRLPQPSLAKALTGTSVVTGNNSNTQAVVGELATYTLTLTVPEGSIASASISDTLDAGLAFVNVTSVAYSAGLSSSNTIGTGSAPSNVTVTSSGRNLTFNLGTITNSNTDNAVPETITITYTAVVLNTNSTPNIQTGTQLNNAATFTGQYTDLPTGTATSYTTPVASATNVAVIEPTLTVLKDASTTNVSGNYTDSLGNVDAGDTIFYRIRITNAAGGPTAFDTLLADTLPTDFSGPSIVSVSGGGFTTADFAITGGVLQNSSAAGIDIVAGTTVEIILQGTLASTVNPAQSIANTASITWTSIDGNPGTISTYDPNSTERTGAGGPGADTAVLNNYAANDGTTIVVSAPANTKTIVATSESFTTVVAGTERVAIGEMIRYRLVLSIPEGTSPDLQIVDNLPTGLVFINDGTATVGFVSAANNLSSSSLSGAGLDLGSAVIQPTFQLPGAAISTSQTVDTDNYDNGTDVRFKLGTITNNASSNGTAESIVIEFNALVLNSSNTGNQSGTTLGNSFTTRINGNTTVGVASATVNVIVAEPNLTAAKAASTTGPVDAGDTFTYTITVSNTASGNNAAPAFDVRVLDLVDQIVAGTNPTAELEYLSYTLGTLPAGTTLLTDASSTATDTLDLTFNRLDAGSSFTITVNVQVKTGALSGAEIENKAAVTFTSLPGTAGTSDGTIATTYGTTDVDLNPGADSVLANADANNGTVNLGANAGERTGADVANPTDNSAPTNNAIRNNYAVAASAAAGLVVQVPTIDKQFKDGTISADDTSVASSTGANVLIGETVTYDLLVTLPEGVIQDLRVQDIVPDGLRIDSIQIITDGSASLASTAFNGTFTTTPTLGTPVTGPATLTLDFDNVTVASDNIAGNNRFVIRVVATVINILTNQQAVTRTNTAQLLFNDPDGSGNAGPAADRTVTDANAGNNPTVTIAEPTVTVAKSVSGPANPDAGDVLTYTITLTNTSGQTAYDVTLSDALSSSLTATTGVLGVIAGSSVTTAGGATASPNAFEIVDLGGGSLVLRTASGANVDLPTGGTITLVYQTTVASGVGPSVSINNIANARWSSIDGGLDGDDAGTVNERTGSDVGDPAPTTINQASTAAPLNNYALSSGVVTTSTNSIVVAKSIVTTSLGGADGVVTPGEIVTYQMTITLPEGVAGDLQIRDAIPAGMAYVAGSIALDTTGYVGSVSAPTAAPVSGVVFGDGTDVTFDFASISTTADNNAANNTFTFTYQTVVLDVAGNDGVLPGQTTLNNTATHNNGSGTTFSGNAGGASVTVVEPNLQVTNAISITGPRDAGAPFTYTITVNPTANATSGAYEVSVADLLPPELGSLAILSATVSDGATTTNVAGNFNITGNQLSTTTPLSLLLNTNGASDQVLTIVLTGSLTSEINPGETVNTNTSLAYTNYPGDRTAAGGFNPNSDVTTDRERSYTGNDTESFTTPNATLAKSLFATSETFTAGSNVAIGETATFALLVTLPEGTTPNLTVVDQLPTGFQYVSATVVTAAASSGGLLTADFAGSVPTPTIAGGASNGDDVTFTFGSISTTGDNVTTNNSFLILVTARVTNTTANQSGTTLANTATLDITGDNAALITTPAVNVSVVEPRVTTAKVVTSATTGLDAGDSVTYQVTINNLAANGATAAAFDVSLDDVLPTGMLVTSIGSPTLNGGATVDTALAGIGSGTLTGIFDIPLNGSVTFTYTAQLPNTVTPGQSLTNDLDVRYTSLDGTNANERTGTDIADPEDNTPPTNNATLNNYAVGSEVSVTMAAPFSVAKSLINTSLGSDASSDVVIGEVLTYQLAVSVMEGTTSNITLVDTLPRVAGVNQLTYVTGSSTLTANGLVISPTLVSYNASTNQLTFTIASVTNPGGSNSTTNDPAVAETDTFLISYQVQVANIAANQSATTLTNDVDATATGVPPDNNNQVTVTVREPVLTLDKTTTTPGIDGGDTVVYTLVIANTGNATAYDINIADTLDAALQLSAPGSALAITGGPGYATLNQAGNTAAAVSTMLNQLNAGDSITITVTAQVRAGAVAGDTISNTASLTYTSLPGTDGGERTGGGGVNDYTISDSSTDFTLARPTIDKRTPADTTYAIGESVTYDILVTVPEGTTNGLIVTDNLPAGLVYTGLQVVTTAAASGGLLTADFAGTVTGAPTVLNPAGNTRTFDFGSVVSTADNVAGNGTFLLRVTARVDNILANQGAGSPTTATQFSNTAVLQFTDGTSGATTVTDPTAPGAISVVEPVLSLDKTVTSVTTGLDAGDIVTYSVSIANTGTSTAHDANFLDVLPAGMIITSGGISSSGGVSIDGSSGGVGQGSVGFQFTIPVGGTITITYSVQLQDSVSAGSLLTNAATLDWSSINGTDPNERTGATGTQGDGSLNDYRLTDSASVTVANPFAVAKSLLTTSESGSTGSDVLIGETLTYELAVTVVEGTTNLLSLVDSLPVSAGQNQLVYLPGTLAVSNANGMTINGLAASYNSTTNQLTITASSVVNPGGSNGTTNGAAAAESDTFFITYQVRVADVAATTSGAVLINDVDGTATGVVPDNDNQATVTVIEPKLQVVKSHNDADGIASVGQTLTYTVVISHTGASNAIAYDVFLDDLLPAGLTYVSGSASLLPSGGVTGLTGNVLGGATFAVTADSIPPGGSITLTYQALIATTATPGVNLENNARIFWDSLPENDQNIVRNPGSESAPDRDYGAVPGVEVYNANTDPAQDTERITVGTASVGDYVWNDLNGDGVQGALEKGIGGVRVFADLNNNSTFEATEPSALTNADGAYTIRGLAPGTYTVRVLASTLPAGVTQTYDLSGPLDNAATITLANGQALTTVDFGYQGAASVGDRVWLDLDGGGTQNDLERGVEGVTLDLLRDLNGDGDALDAGEGLIAQTTTNATGDYSFTGLIGGNYIVRVTDTANVLANATATFDLDGVATTGQAAFLLGATQSRTDVDFGYRGASSLGDRVWNDLDGNGTQDPTEFGISGVTMQLEQLIGGSYVAIATTTTGADGAYTFSGLIGDSYRVTVTTPPASSTATFDLDGVATPSTAVRVLTSNESATDVDFGYRGSAAIGDYVWFDQNLDGVQDGGEPALPGVRVFIDLGGDGSYTAGVDPFQTTNASGFYQFTGLVAGSYSVVVDQSTLPAGLRVPTWDRDSLTVSPDGIALVTVGAAETVSNADFGFRGEFSIAGRSYHDQQKNGSFDGTDTGLGGVTVELLWDADNSGNFSMGDYVITSTLTNADGTYSFGNLIIGNYLVRETQPSGFGEGAENATDVAAVNVAVGTVDYTANFGNTTGSIAGRVFSDKDNDGAVTGTDTGLSGVSVTLEWSGTDGVFGTGDDRSVTVQTDTSGNYLFDYSNTAGFVSGFGDTTAGLLSNGFYRIIEAQPTDYLDGAETAGNATGNAGGVDEGTHPGYQGRGGADQIGIAGNYIQLADGQDATGYLFAELAPSSIAGYVYVDSDGDGQKGKTESGIPGVEIQLTGTNDLGETVDVTVKTDADGKFLFENIRPGTYTLLETQPPGYTDDKETLGTAGGDKSINDIISGIVITPGTVATDYLFAEVPIPPVIPPPEEVTSRPTPPEPKPEPFVFAFDSFNNFANSNSSENAVSPWISSIDNWRPAMLPLAPIYSGAANPGATLVIDLYNANGVHIGSQTVIADSGGNWLANFTSVVLRDAPSEVRITQTNAPYSFGAGTGHNLRTYYAPAALNPGHFLGQTHHNGTEEESAPLLSGLNLANPISLGPVKYGGEVLASEGVAAGD